MIVLAVRDDVVKVTTGISWRSVPYHSKATEKVNWRTRSRTKTRTVKLDFPSADAKSRTWSSRSALGALAAILSGINGVESMTKSELIEHISELRNLPRARAELAVNMILECLGQALSRNERVEIRGLGSFETRRYGSYKGRNPRTGASVAVKPKRLPYFKVGKELKDLINSKLRRTQELPALQVSSATSTLEQDSRSATSTRKR
jgi:integration host factor subunit beta